MRATVPVWADFARAIVPASLALALGLAAQGPIRAQDDSDEATAAATQARLTGLLGPWIRNDELSDDPVLKVQGMRVAPKRRSPTVHELAQALADRYGTVMIRILEDALALLDDRGAARVLALNGRQYPLGRGVKGRILDTDETLTIEMVASDWQRSDTFFLLNDRLVRMTDLKVRSQPRLEFSTVYDRPEVAPVSDSTAAGAAQPAAIRIVPPERRVGELLSGRVEIQTLIVDPRVGEVEFLLDGKRTRRVRSRPFTARIGLADPPREQRLEALAYDRQDEYIGRDEILLNQIDRPFAVHIAEIHSAQANGDPAIRVAASVSLPRAATLERVEFYRSENLVSATHTFGEDGAPGVARTIPVEALIEDGRPDDFIRVVAKLADGREREDAALLQGADYRSEIDVQLAQFQVLVTDRDGNPVSGLSPEDFEIRENGRKRAAVALHTAYDVPLVLGLAIDSSDSMLSTWRRLKHIARGFLEAALRLDDRSFLVDFDGTVRLIQPLTADQPLLHGRLDHLIPLGGTALNDGLLFSLLQYRREPGRRALVVVTDGADQHSRSQPEQSADLAERLGLPIYFIELDASGQGTGNSSGVVAFNVTSTLKRQRARKRLSRISEQTGGRLFHIELYAATPRWTDRIEQVFDQIEEDLRHQHVLTYYSDQPPGTPVEPEIRVTRRGLKLRSAVALQGIE